MLTPGIPVPGMPSAAIVGTTGRAAPDRGPLTMVGRDGSGVWPTGGTSTPGCADPPGADGTTRTLGADGEPGSAGAPGRVGSPDTGGSTSPTGSRTGFTTPATGSRTGCT